MAYASDVSGSKLKAKLSTAFNEAAASTAHLQPSSFAARHMKKMGWTEGTGLGKNKHGIVSHLRVKKRDDELKLGLGSERGESHHGNMNSHHAQHAMIPLILGETLMKLQKRKRESSSSSIIDDDDDDDNDDEDDVKTKEKEKKKKKQKRKSEKRKEKKRADHSIKAAKREKHKSTQQETIKIYTDEELFIATGGARFGMRAQRRAEGKWKRTESGELLNHLEVEAKQKMEWNGLGTAKLLLKEK